MKHTQNAQIVPNPLYFTGLSRFCRQNRDDIFSSSSWLNKLLFEAGIKKRPSHHVK